MAQRKKVVGPNDHLYHRTDHYCMPDGRVIEQGEIIKIQGIWGSKFKFHNHVVRTDSGVEWIDCFELSGGQVCVWRSFRVDRIKVIPKKRKRKNVKND
jgi:hypothetical protein